MVPPIYVRMLVNDIRKEIKRIERFAVGQYYQRERALISQARCWVSSRNLEKMTSCYEQLIATEDMKPPQEVVSITTRQEPCPADVMKKLRAQIDAECFGLRIRCTYWEPEA